MVLLRKNKLCLSLKMLAESRCAASLLAACRGFAVLGDEGLEDVENLLLLAAGQHNIAWILQNGLLCTLVDAFFLFRILGRGFGIVILGSLIGLIGWMLRLRSFC